MHILGINAYHADSSAAIFKDGLLIAATEEERFRRVKHWAGFPSLAVEFCLREAGITLAQLDHIAIGRDPYAKLGKKLWFLLKNPGGGWRAATDRLQNARKVSSLEEEFAAIDPSVDASSLKKKIHQVEHHRSHLASAFFASPFEEAALLSIDGSGDFTTTMIATGQGNKIRVLDSVDFPHSVGLFYTAFTQLLGFPHYGDEYKVMGLAPYGKPDHVDALRDVLLFQPDGLFRLNLKYFRSATRGIISYGEDHIPQVAPLFSPYMVEKFGAARAKDQPLTQYHKDLAASVQRITEELIFHILGHLQTRTGLKNICIAGGVAQNSVANGKLTRNTPFTGVYIPSAGHDAGISMGAALYVYNQVLDQPRAEAVRTAYTGSRFSNEDIEQYLRGRHIDYRRYPDSELYEKVADRLIDAGVVGWFNGRAEFGPRALGARSILADPRRSDAKDLLNSKIKRRESFRPFAPSILKEYVKEYFEVEDEVPFMEKVFPIRPEKRALIPAVTHVDGTGRLQSVDRSVTPRYYQLIEAFRKKTGVPILLNTSFNENEPIVNSPEHALDCFLRTDMDMLVLENCVITRRPGV
ncbi:MAG: carbamoyltransferase C-terminal domain-containing protein [Bacteroidota bacterium]|nr:carbamoyltransferase C-terminal domain-containing protein [Bacteroidota bacterium]MDP4215090.1 carbamoyltransferase C-terminal domain-containing protein [Bacteroidota bacterium]MDP4253728.1 carbamoyltransferase C-terminal domain-containing protein [Bacteroidota bacterium]MDP4258023.1 carbamoyltransferase C-terminal domain-containing protein [Bacteroidota bacterium]